LAPASNCNEGARRYWRKCAVGSRRLAWRRSNLIRATGQ
jgi:hypothetical protein